LPEGVVESYSEQKGFGFVMNEEGKKILFYRSSILQEGYKTVKVGERVKFEIKNTELGLEAEEIMRL
jgi:CspA family cold shock protein